MAMHDKHSPIVRRPWRLCLWIALAGAALMSHAHNTNTTHPRITELAGDLIEAEDAMDPQYAELAQTQGSGQDVRRVWLGHNPGFTEADAGADSAARYPAFLERNVMGGIVREDDPVGRVFSHFYNGYTGDRMPLEGNFANFVTQVLQFGEFIDAEYTDSKEVAVRFFDISVEVFGYLEDDHAEPAKPLGYWVFGRSLHHLEDMDSVAHVSSDPHLTIGLPFEPLERDDFEGHYVPTKLWVPDALVTGPLQSATQAVNITSFDQIWSAPCVGNCVLETAGVSLVVPSLARSVYNLGTFHGQLEYPINIPEYLIPNQPPLPGTPDGNPSVTCGMNPPLDTVYTGTGELADMFNESGVDCDLTWEWFDISQYARWDIEGVGNYRYQEAQPDIGAGSDWWSVQLYGGPCVLPGCAGDAEYFYLEQVMRGQNTGAAFDSADLVVPRGLRTRYDEIWHPVNNKVMAGNQAAILDKYAAHVLPLGPAYAAGYLKMWYDVVNTPPYLKRVAVTQGGERKYRAGWDDDVEESQITLVDTSIFPLSDSIEFGYVARRFLKLDPEVPIPLFLNSSEKIEITLEFNEPIQDPTETNFELALGDAVIAFANYTAQKLTTDLDGNALDKPWNAGKSWLITIQAANVPDLDGRIALRVKARDKNNHWGGSGVELDDDPATPARRQRRNPMQPREAYVQDAPGWLAYPWHTEDSQDVNFAGMEAGDFAYTFGSGDASHILLFDASAPEIDGAISVD